MFTQQPILLKNKDAIQNRIKKFIDKRRKEGYRVKAKVMFFTPIDHRKPKEVKVLVSAVKIEPFLQPKLMILRCDGTWK